MHRGTSATLAMGVVISIAMCLTPSPAEACKCVANTGGYLLWTEEAFSRHEVIVEGTLTQRDPVAGDFKNSETKHAKMLVHKVWKGDVGRFATILFHEASGSCGAAPPVHRVIRIATSIAWDGSLRFGACMNTSNHYDPGLIRLHDAYMREIDALKQRVTIEGRPGEFALATFLRKNHELHRAAIIYDSLLERDAADFDALLGAAVLAERTNDHSKSKILFENARKIAGERPDGPGKLACAEFEARSADASSGDLDCPTAK